MLIPIRRITFTNSNGRILQYDYVCEIEIDKNRENLTDTAIIKIPRKLVYKSGAELNSNNQTSQLDYIQPTAIGDTQNITYIGGQDFTKDAMFKRGDKVKIELGYYPNLQTRFEGYISKVISTLPFEIHCENKMWILKQSNCVFPDPSKWTYTKKRKNTVVSTVSSITLKELLDGILGFVSERITYKTVDDNMNLGHLRVDNRNAALVLEVLKNKYGLYSYFQDDGILYVGFKNNAQLTNVQEFTMDGPNGVVINSQTLQWTNAGDVPIKVKGISVTPDNKTFTYEAGQDGGDFLTQYTYGQSEAGLKKWVDNMLPTLNYNGWRGDIHTIGEPIINPGDVCRLTSLKLPERNGDYLIKGVKIKDGSEGYFQTISLGIALQRQ